MKRNENMAEKQPRAERADTASHRERGTGERPAPPPNRKRDAGERPAPPSLPKESDFRNAQLDLFQQFLCNTESERGFLSNIFDIWDSVPRYSVSRQAMQKMRAAKGFLDILEIDFTYRGTDLKAVIHPARVKGADGATLDYYPGANEELVEDALRKMAAEQYIGYFDKPNHRSGVVFTLHMLRDELRKRGHARSYQQIVLSLNILSGSIIELRAADGSASKSFTRTPYFPSLSAVSRKSLESDPKAKWMVQFHPLVTQSIDVIGYRQFNYHQMMGHTTQLARWLHKQLSLKYTMASLTTHFEMRYSTIKRNSGLLENYNPERKAVAALDEAFEDLRQQNVLLTVGKRVATGPRGKIEDVAYVVTPTIEFVKQMKAANKRLSEAVDKSGKTCA